MAGLLLAHGAGGGADHCTLLALEDGFDCRFVASSFRIDERAAGSLIVHRS